ncbi:MAG: TonB-dependent receptor [Myxococcota bacterium]|nr:TonB-dependent receptor [Myxococcota bacterium]
MFRELALRIGGLALIGGLLLAIPSLGYGAGSSDSIEQHLQEIWGLAEEEFVEVTVVSATKTAQSLQQAPAVMTVITQKELKRWGYSTLAEVLEHTVGFYVVDDHITPNVAVRGIADGLRGESSIIKVMVDGHPIAYRPTSGNWLGAELIPLGMIRQIEIIRGPASALYGADAFMGVINIITRKTFDEAAIAISGNKVERASNYGFDVDGSWGKRFGDLHVVSSVRYHQEDRSGMVLPITSPAPSIPAYSETYGDQGELTWRKEASGLTQNSLVGLAQLRYQVGPESYISGGGYYSMQKRGGEFAEWTQLSHSSDENGTSHGTQISRMHGAVFLDALFNPAQHLSFTVSGTGFYGGDQGDGKVEVANPNYHITQVSKFEGGDLQLGFRWSPGTSVTVVGETGLSYDREHLPETNLVLKRAGEIFEKDDKIMLVASSVRSLWNPGALLQATWEAIAQRLTLTAGMRYDYHNIYGNQLSGRVGLVGSPEKWLILKLLYGSAFKAPSPQLLYGVPIRAGDVLGNPDLRPQFVQTIEGQIFYKPTTFFSLTSNLAYNYLKDKAEFSLQGLNRVARNVAATATLVFEETIEAHYKNWFGGYLKYEQVWAKRDLGLKGYQASVLGRENAVYPKLQVRAGVWTQMPPLYLRLCVQGRYVGKRRASDMNILERGDQGPYDIDPYSVVDVMISSFGLSLGDSKDLDLQLVAKNLLNTQAIYPGVAGIDYPHLPRTFVAKLDLRF